MKHLFVYIFSYNWLKIFFMLKSNEIKFIKSLYLKKNRDEKSLFIVEGEKIVSELINSDFVIDKVYATEAYYDLYSSKIKEEMLFKITQKELSRISNLKSPNNVLAIVKKKNIELDYDKIQGLTLVLDNINDPGNFGTIIRSCNWFNINNIICSNNTVDLYNSKVIQSSMGSLLRVDVFYTNLVDFFEKCSDNFHVYGAVLEGQDSKTVNVKPNSLLIIGNESHGISDALKQFIDTKITIKKFSDQIDSLNAATATSIMLYEFSK